MPSGVSQPSFALLLQSAQPASQIKVHVPALQPGAWAPVRAGQTLPQAPQLAASVWVSMAQGLAASQVW